MKPLGSLHGLAPSAEMSAALGVNGGATLSHSLSADARPVMAQADLESSSPYHIAGRGAEWPGIGMSSNNHTLKDYA